MGLGKGGVFKVKGQVRGDGAGGATVYRARVSLEATGWAAASGRAWLGGGCSPAATCTAQSIRSMKVTVETKSRSEMTTGSWCDGAVG